MEPEPRALPPEALGGPAGAEDIRGALAGTREVPEADIREAGADKRGAAEAGSEALEAQAAADNERQVAVAAPEAAGSCGSSGELRSLGDAPSVDPRRLGHSRRRLRVGHSCSRNPTALLEAGNLQRRYWQHFGSLRGFPNRAAARHSAHRLRMAGSRSWGNRRKAD